MNLEHEDVRRGGGGGKSIVWRQRLRFALPASGWLKWQVQHIIKVERVEPEPERLESEAVLSVADWFVAKLPEGVTECSVTFLIMPVRDLSGVLRGYGADAEFLGEVT